MARPARSASRDSVWPWPACGPSPRPSAASAARAGGPAVLWPLVTARAASLGLLAVVGGVVGALGLPRGRSTLGLTALAGVLDTGGNAFFVLAALAGRLDVAGVLSSLYPASTVALACVLLRERFTPRQTAGAAATLGAIACISL
jgi:drug/metabolite transporter (DMT)-like permease